MRLAGHDTVVEIGGATVRLRPSLRAAIVLERDHDGFGQLVRALQAGSVTVTAAVLTACGDHPAPADLVTAGPEPIGSRLQRLAPALIAFVLELADVSPPDIYERDEAAGSGEAVSVREALADLFGIATGILGWSPAVAYAATPAEIWVAFDQRHAMLVAQAGGQPRKRRRTGPNNGVLDSAGLASLASMGGAI